jgi:hypothetical protein
MIMFSLPAAIPPNYLFSTTVRHGRLDSSFQSIDMVVCLAGLLARLGIVPCDLQYYRSYSPYRSAHGTVSLSSLLVIGVVESTSYEVATTTTIYYYY